MQNYGMRSPAAITTAAVLLVAACTPLRWVRQDADPGELERDFAACRREAWLRSHEFVWWHDPFGPLVMQDRQGRPVVVRPYAPFSDPLLVEARLEQFCMQDKGYRLVPVEPEK